MNEEALARLSALKTEHPGGYQDIITALRTANRDLKQPNGIKVHTGDILSDIERAVMTTPNPNTPGLVAGAIHQILQTYKLPTPGHKDWTKPALTWFK